MHLLIVRHGECMGQCDPSLGMHPDTVLSPAGERQSQLTGQRLAHEGITHILSSPLLRSLATAAIIAATAGDLPIEVWPELRELWTDTYRGHGRAELQQQFPRATLPAEISIEGWHHGGDTYDSLFARCQHVLARLKERFHVDQRVVLVTHGGFANYLLHTILHIPSTTPQWFEMDNCAISRVRFVPEYARRKGWALYPAVEAEILSVNDRCHLSKAV